MSGLNTNQGNHLMAGSDRITCSRCKAQYTLTEASAALPKYCSFCGELLNPQSTRTQGHSSSHGLEWQTTSVTLIQGHMPQQEMIQFVVGPYQVLRSIGKGGMGEVFLAYDTTCGRRIALKKIREDLINHPLMHNRFLKEARVTSQLTHPSIIPIYAIHAEAGLIYYTMPYVEGETLKEILRKTRNQEKKGEKLDHIGGSIPALIRIFINICQAIAYAHMKGVLHRDLKPENIIIGKYGEVMILDWGLAKLLSTDGIEEGETFFNVESSPLHGLTNVGKVVGTVAYMPPERALGIPATVKSDIYSLGVILFQMLTLRQPFKRGTLKEFRETFQKETVPDPITVAPYRDIPKVLSQMATKCLSHKLEERYSTVDEIIRELENFIEGRSEWFLSAELDIYKKQDWEFQENVLIAEHTAITRHTEVSDWVSMMISKASFNENLKIEANVRLGLNSLGLGFLVSVPETSERIHLNDGYCVWLGSDLNKSTKLLRSAVEVLHADDIFLKRGEWTHIKIEKVEKKIQVTLNDSQQFSYISHLPLVGTHMGLLSRDADFEISPIKVFVGSQNITVNCLAVPDAFLSNKDYPIALSEYRRIGYSFPGRAEGREAMFRAGITLLEQATSTGPEERTGLYDMAYEEFGKLHNTPGAPLEYLGKALAYQAMGEYEEEIKCFELAYRRYPQHPLLSVLQEQISYRTQESSRFDRRLTYEFILLSVQHIPLIAQSNHAVKLLNNLQKHWEPLYFIDDNPAEGTTEKAQNATFTIPLAFWLNKPYVLNEIFEQLSHLSPLPISSLWNIIFSLRELGELKMARDLLDEEEERLLTTSQAGPLKKLSLLKLLFARPEEALANLRGKLSEDEEKILIFTLENCIDQGKTSLIHEACGLIDQENLKPLSKQRIHCIRIWAYLLEKNWRQAGEILNEYPLEWLNRETSLLHFLYACWLAVTEGKELAQIHFEGVLEIAYPRSWTLCSHYLIGTLSQDWMKKAFYWERKQLDRQLRLYNSCIS